MIGGERKGCKWRQIHTDDRINKDNDFQKINFEFVIRKIDNVQENWVTNLKNEASVPKSKIKIKPI